MNETKLGDLLGAYDQEGVVGLLKVKKFEGVTIRLGPKYLKNALSALCALNKDEEEVQIGISNSIPGGGFYIFLDDKHEIAICIAGRLEP